MTIYYLDANALVKFYDPAERGYQTLHRLVSQHKTIISEVTMLETVNVFVRQFRGGKLKRRQLRRLIKRLKQDVGTLYRPFVLVPVTPLPTQTVRTILIQQATINSIGMIDALHLAYMLELQTTYENLYLLTSDRPMQQAATRLNISFFDPEKSE